MNIIENMLKWNFRYELYGGLSNLWLLANGGLQYLYPDSLLEYDAEIVFFEALEVMLKSGNQCLFHNLNGEDPSRDGEHLTGSPTEQIALLKKVWIGKEAKDQQDYLKSNQLFKLKMMDKEYFLH